MSPENCFSVSCTRAESLHGGEVTKTNFGGCAFGTSSYSRDIVQMSAEQRQDDTVLLRENNGLFLQMIILEISFSLKLFKNNFQKLFEVNRWPICIFLDTMLC